MARKCGLAVNDSDAGLHGITFRRNEGFEQGFHVKLDCKSRQSVAGSWWVLDSAQYLEI